MNTGSRRSSRLIDGRDAWHGSYGRNGIRHGLLLFAGKGCHFAPAFAVYVIIACVSVAVQVTFQAKDITESRFLYDQLSVLSPICVRCGLLLFPTYSCCNACPQPCVVEFVQLALTAASPVFKGMVVDTDTRWDVIAASVDCRTPIERGISTEV